VSLIGGKKKGLADQILCGELRTISGLFDMGSEGWEKDSDLREKLLLTFYPLLQGHMDKGSAMDKNLLPTQEGPMEGGVVSKGKGLGL